MKKFVLLICLLVSVVSAHAQFEKGKWVVNPSLTGTVRERKMGSQSVAYGFGAVLRHGA